MSEKAERLAKRSLKQHREAVAKERVMFSSMQRCLNEICDSITDLNAAVMALIDIEAKRKRRKEPR